MIRQWLRDMRTAQGMSQKGVANLVGISQPSYHQIESGENNPSVDTAKKIADVLQFEWPRFYQDDQKGA